MPPDGIFESRVPDKLNNNDFMDQHGIFKLFMPSCMNSDAARWMMMYLGSNWPTKFAQVC
jgi:hypothetical protein